MVKTLLGRLRRVPELASSKIGERQFAERIAVNTPIQGTAADLIKLAMIEIAKRLKAESLKARMILQVHDELVFEVPEAEIDKAQALVVECMENVYPMHVPIKVDCSVGKNWMETKA